MKQSIFLSSMLALLLISCQGNEQMDLYQQKAPLEREAPLVIDVPLQGFQFNWPSFGWVLSSLDQPLHFWIDAETLLKERGCNYGGIVYQPAPVETTISVPGEYKKTTLTMKQSYNIPSPIVALKDGKETVAATFLKKIQICEVGTMLCSSQTLSDQDPPNSKVIFSIPSLETVAPREYTITLTVEMNCSNVDLPLSSPVMVSWEPHSIQLQLSR